MKLNFSNMVVAAFASAALVTMFQNCGVANFDVSNLSDLPSISSASQVGGPVIQQKSNDLTVTSGEPAVFSVVATGANLQYEWYKDDAPIQGETGSTYTIDASQAADMGTYTVVVYNDEGEIAADFVLIVQ